WRRVDVDDQLRIREGLSGRGPRGVPDVLADVHAKEDIPQLDDRGALARAEISVLVENPVVWQEYLVVNRGDHAIVHDCRCVVNVGLHVDEADDGGDAFRG